MATLETECNCLNEVPSCECGNPCPGEICTECGLVHGRVYEGHHHMRARKNSLEVVRFGYSASPFKLKGSLIGWLSKYAGIKWQKDKWERLDRYDKSITIDTNAKIFVTLKILQEVGALLGLPPSVLDRASYLYMKIIKKRFDVPNRVTLVATCLYMAVVETALAISVHDICHAFRARGHRVNTRLVTRDYLDYRRDVNHVPRKRDVAPFIVALLKSMSASKPGPDDEYITELTSLAIRLSRHQCPYSFSTRNVAAAALYTADRILSDEKGIPQRFRFLTQRSFEPEIPSYSVRDIFKQWFEQFMKGMKGEDA